MTAPEPGELAPREVGAAGSAEGRYAGAVLRQGDATARRDAGSRWPAYGVLALLLAMIGIWFTLIRRFGEGDVYAVIGPYATGICVAMLALRPRAMAEWLRPGLRPILIGLGVGIGMTALTYPVFQLGVRL